MTDFYMIYKRVDKYLKEKKILNQKYFFLNLILILCRQVYGGAETMLRMMR